MPPASTETAVSKRTRARGTRRAPTPRTSPSPCPPRARIFQCLPAPLHLITPLNPLWPLLLALQHPTEPWVLCGLYTGKALIYNYSTQTVVKSFDVSELPVR